MTRQSQGTRIGQQTPDTLPRIQFAEMSAMPTAPWDGMVIYRTDLQTVQVYQLATNSWMDVVGGEEGVETFVGPDEPTEGKQGDLWIKTPDNVLYFFDNNAWVLSTGTGNRTYFQSAAPTNPRSGDTWIDEDDDHATYIYKNGGWQPVTSDGQPPSMSPTAVVVGGLNSLTVSWQPVPNQSLVTYDVYVAFDPVEGPDFFITSDRLVHTTTGSQVTFGGELKPGVPLNLSMTQPYHARIVARDRDGAAVPGVSGYDYVRQVTGAYIAPNTIVQGNIADFAIHAKKLNVQQHFIF